MDILIKINSAASIDTTNNRYYRLHREVNNYYLLRMQFKLYPEGLYVTILFVYITHGRHAIDEKDGMRPLKVLRT